MGKAIAIKEDTLPFLSTDPLTYLVRLMVVFAILPVHECAHAWTSYKLGDPTAKNLGRMTINPLKHIDVIGALCLVFAGFGWAKPVPVDARYYRNRKYGMALSALAGPAANFLMSLVFLAVGKVFYGIFAAGGYLSTTLYYVYYIFALIAQISLSLAVFNFLPVPPLDGSRILLLFLPERTYFNLMRYERYISYALFALLFFGLLDRPLSFLTNLCWNAVNWMTAWIPALFGLGA